MKSLFSFFSKNKNGHDSDDLNVPWMETPSIYEHILGHLDPVTGRLTEDGVTLPDEERRYAKSVIRWAPGALDGAFGHYWAPNTDSKKAHTIVSHVIEIAAHNTRKDKVALYDSLIKDDLLDFIDPALDEIGHSGVSPYPHLHEFATFLAKGAPDRGPVKFAIALLGLIGNESDGETISLLGLHEEFTLYSAVALSNLLQEPERELELWELAKKVDGWGRIHLVERLASSDSPEIKDWLLRDGFRNSIMYEYLAFSCATGGDLKAALAAKEIDDDLFDAAGEILAALIAGGPAENIEDYRDAAVVITAYLHLLESRDGTLQHFDAVNHILGYLTDDSWDEQQKEANGWTLEIRTSAIQTARDILQHPRWTPMVHEGLASQDYHTFYLADRAAQSLGIDTWEVHWARLQQEPLEQGRWYYVMRLANSANIGVILDFAASVLPLQQVATGAADELGLGPEFAVHRCLDYIVQELEDYPTHGWPLIAAALKSPVVRNRNMALRALSAWGQANWTTEIEEALTEALLAEPREDVRERIGKVLKGETLE